MTRKNSFEYFEFVIEKRFTIKYNANAGVNVGGGFDLYGFGGKSFLDDMNLGVSFGSNRGINGNLSYNPKNPFGNGTVTRNLGLETTLNFGTNGINGNLSGELSGANVLTYSAGQNMTGNLSFNDNLQNDLAKSKSLRAGEEEYQRKLAEFMQLKENSIRDYYLNQLNNPELYQEYLNADPEKQDQMLKAMEIDKYGKNSKSNANFFTRALSDAGGYFSSIAGFGYSDADSFTDSEGEFHQRTCFVKGTLVTVEQNTSGAFEKGGTWFKKIEEIKAGDRVLSKNEITGELDYKTVTKLFLHEVELLFKLRIIGGAIIETTWNHPFMIKGRGWVEVKDLRIGDGAILHDGRLTQIQSIEQVRVSSTKVYNLEVEDFHTYFVGEDGVWVHNYVSDFDVAQNNQPGFFTGVAQRFSNWWDDKGFNTDFELREALLTNIKIDGGEYDRSKLPNVDAIKDALKTYNAAPGSYSEDLNMQRALAVTNDNGVTVYPNGARMPIKVTNDFGPTPAGATVDRKYHTGSDSGTDTGTDAVAVAPGKVIHVDNDAKSYPYGKSILILHDNGVVTRYAHADSVNVKPGQTVKPGDVVIQTGNTGKSTKPHLHFEVYQDTSGKLQNLVDSKSKYSTVNFNNKITTLTRDGKSMTMYNPEKFDWNNKSKPVIKQTGQTESSWVNQAGKK